MTDFIVILVLAAILGSAAWYIRKSKKSGKACIGCPHNGSCSSCHCHCGEQDESPEM